MIKKVFLGIVIAIGSMLLLLVLLMVAYAFYSVLANDKADAAAKKLCTAIRVGSDIDTVIKKAARNTEESRLSNSSDGEYRFTFSGAIFHASVCKVKAAEGKVVSTEFVVYDD